MARIGLLEDNNRIAKICSIVLDHVGHEVTIYRDADECLNALHVLDLTARSILQDEVGEKNKALPIDVLILDLRLPTLPGLEVLRLLRSTPHTCKLPLILCTAAAPAELKSAFVLAPDALLVEKPFRLQVLVSAISSVLQTTPR